MSLRDSNGNLIKDLVSKTKFIKEKEKEEILNYLTYKSNAIKGVENSLDELTKSPSTQSREFGYIVNILSEVKYDREICNEIENALNLWVNTNPTYINYGVRSLALYFGTNDTTFKDDFYEKIIEFDTTLINISNIKLDSVLIYNYLDLFVNKYWKGLEAAESYRSLIELIKFNRLSEDFKSIIIRYITSNLICSNLLNYLSNDDLIVTIKLINELITFHFNQENTTLLKSDLLSLINICPQCFIAEYYNFNKTLFKDTKIEMNTEFTNVLGIFSYPSNKYKILSGLFSSMYANYDLSLLCSTPQVNFHNLHLEVISTAKGSHSYIDVFINNERNFRMWLNSGIGDNRNISSLISDGAFLKKLLGKKPFIK